MTCVLKVLIFKQMSHIKLPSLARFISILTSSKNDSWIKVKNYFSTLAVAGGDNYSYLNLTTAAEQTKAKKFHLYAVVLQILKVIILQRFLFTTLLQLI